MRTLLPFFLLFWSACRSEDGLKVYNFEPVAMITSHADGAEILEGYSTTFIGSISDVNHEHASLVVTWSTNNEVLCEQSTPSSVGETSCTGILAEDDLEIKLQVIDPEGAADVNIVGVVVIPTTAPTATIIRPIETGVYYSDQKVTFEGTVLDEEDDEELLIASWESDLDGLLSSVDGTPDGAGSVLGFGYLTEGEHALTLNVEDTTGKTARDSVIIRVGPPNSAPECSITTPTTNSVGQEGENIDFMAIATDIDVSSDILSVLWSSDKDGVLSSSAPSSTGDILLSFSDLSVNTHTITMTVTDEVGTTCTDFISYTVGTPPELTITLPIDGDVYTEGTLIDFSALVSDGQDLATDIALDWSLNGNSLSAQGATSSGIAQYQDSSLPYGSYTLVVTATDNDGLTDTDQISFTINGLPTQPNISITPSAPNTGSILVVHLDTPSIDPEGNSITYTYEWYKDNILQSSQQTSSIASVDTKIGEFWSVLVTPNDGIGNGIAGEANITIGNTEPTLNNLSITPLGTIYNDEIPTCSVTVTDPDEPLTPTFEWSSGGNLIGTGSVIDLSTTTLAPEAEVFCTASVVDAMGAQATDSTSIIIENRAPRVDSISIIPSAVYADDTITAIATFSDDDGIQTITGTYTWHVIDYATGIDTEVQSGTDNTLDGTPFFGKDDEVYVIVTPNDGLDDGIESTSTSTTILNTPPSIAIIELLPDPAIEGQDDLICSISTPSTDDDGDAISYTYTWFDHNNSLVQTTSGVTATSDVFLGSGTEEGVWTCTVVANDGSIDGLSTSTTTVVETSSTCMSLDFDGVDDFVSISESLLNNRTSGTIETWVYSDTVNDETIISKQRDSVNTYSVFSIGYSVSGTGHGNGGSSGAMYFHGRNGTGSSPSQQSVQAGIWQHIAVTFSSSKTIFYIDGVAVGTTLGNFSIPNDMSSVTKIGSWHSHGNEFDGKLYEFRIWDAERSQSQIQSNMNTLLTGSEAGLRALLTYDEFNTGVFRDLTSNGFNGSINGATWVVSCP